MLQWGKSCKGCEAGAAAATFSASPTGLWTTRGLRHPPCPATASTLRRAVARIMVRPP